MIEKVLGCVWWQKQLDIIESVRNFRRTLSTGCTGSGKTRAAAYAVFWWLLGHGPLSRVFTLAPSQRQVQTNLWMEINAIHQAAPVKLGGHMQMFSWRLGKGWQAFGFSTDDPELARGGHGPYDLIMLDDLQGFQQRIVDSVDNMMAGVNGRILALANKSRLSGEVYDAHHKDRGRYNLIGCKASETPNVMAGREVIPGLISPEFVKEKLDKHGKGSFDYNVFVEDEFPEQESSAVVPLKWAEMAVKRGRGELLDAQGQPIPAPSPHGSMVLGADIARLGRDRFVLTPFKDPVMFMQKVFRKLKGPQIVGEITSWMDKLKASCTFVDVIGVGGPILDDVEDQGYNAKPIDVSEGSDVPRDTRFPKGHKDFKKKYHNKRAEVHFVMAEALDPDSPDAITLPDDPELIAELCEARYHHNIKGEIIVEEKTEIIKRLGRSPDKGDSAQLAVFGARRVKVATSASLVSVGTEGEEDDRNVV